MNRFGKICRILGILKKVKISEDCFEIFEYYRFNFWNPLSWLLLFILSFWYILIGDNIREYYNAITDDIVISITKEEDDDYD